MPGIVVRQRTTHLRAIQWTGDNLDEVFDWLDGRLIGHNADQESLLIQRRSGNVHVYKGEWLTSMDYDVVVFPAATFDILFESVPS